MSKVTYGQSGYVGQSMSVRATKAYDDGKMPKSKWTKQAMIDALDEYCYDEDVNPSIDATLLTKADLAMFLDYAEWHHTGSYANQTMFYSFDAQGLVEETWAHFNQSRRDDHDAAYVTVELKADGRQLDGGLYGRVFVSDTGERHEAREYTVVASKLTETELCRLGRQAAEQRWEAWKAQCEERGVHPVDQRHANTEPAGMFRAPEPVYRQALAEYFDKHGYYPDSVAAFAAEHPELVRECTDVESRQTFLMVDGIAYASGDLAKHRVKDYYRYGLPAIRGITTRNCLYGAWEDPCAGVMAAQMLPWNHKWMASGFISMPQIRVQPCTQDTGHDLAAVLDELWEPLYND